MAAGIATRLLWRERYGRAGSVHTSLVQGALTTLPILWRRTEIPPAFDPMPKQVPAPAWLTFQGGDGGWVQVYGGWEEVPLLLECLAVAGRSLDDLASLGPAERHAAWQEVFALRPTSAWIAAIREWGALAEPVADLGAMLRDQELVEEGYVVEVVDPLWGATRQAASPFLSEPPCWVRGPAPALNEGPGTFTAPRATRRRGDEQPRPGPFPLSGLRVLDFGAFIAGPVAPMLMADLGADVIKVEPLGGDRFRTSGPLWLGVQRGKRSIAIDLTRPEGRPIIEALVRRCDVVHHNMRVAAAQKLGLDEASVRAVNPQVIYCHVTAFGTRGARADAPGYDPTTQALAGWMQAQGGRGNPPSYIRFGMMDQQAGLASLVGTILALYHRERTGRAGRIDASLYASAATSVSETLVCLDDQSLGPVAELDAAQTGLGAGYAIYRAADGWIAVAALSEDRMRAFSRITGHSPGNPTPSLQHRMVDELVGGLESAGVPAEQVRTDRMAAFFDDEENRRLGLVASYRQSEYGQMDQPGGVWSFNDLDLRLDRPPPAIGEHSVEILDELGWRPQEIAELVAGAVVGDGAASSVPVDRGS
jgi:crotonobetainyl-CoA:carnitine CoA-transferase CaiB-like acyl-CoA transferase